MTVSVERSAPGRIAVRVAEDGTGVPDRERDLITGDTRVSQLEHGSGLGLWVVRWVTLALDGDVEFEKRTPRGSAVVLKLPAEG